MSHSSKTCFGKRSNQTYFKEGMGCNLVNSYKAVKQVYNIKKDWKGGLKALDKWRSLYIMDKHTCFRELKNISETQSKVMNKYESSIKDRSSSDYNSPYLVIVIETNDRIMNKRI